MQENVTIIENFKNVCIQTEMSSSKPTTTYFDKDVRPHFFDPAVTRRAHFQLAFLQSSISERKGWLSISLNVVL